MPDPTPHPAPERRGGLAAIVVVAVVGFILLAHALHLDPTYAGLVYFWYWAVIGEAKPRAMPSSLLGALLGVGMAALLQYAVRSHQPIEIVGVLLLIVAAVVVDVMRLLPFAINGCCMLFLTIACAPLLQGSENFVLVVEAILLAAVYFGLIVVALVWLQARGQSRRPL
jgi:hypothetical protein